MRYSIIEGVFHVDLEMTSAEQREGFEYILTESVDCSMDTVRAIHEQLKAKVDEAEEPLALSSSDLGAILSDCGVSEDQATAFKELYTKRFGKAALNPENIVDLRRLEIKSGDVTITVAPDQSYLIESREIDGKKYIMIPADGGAELNGFTVRV